MTRIFISALLSLALSACGQTDKKAVAHTDKKPGFEKIIFNTTGCFGPCPTYHLEVDKNKHLKLFAERVFKDSETHRFEADSSKMGYFKGTLSDSLFNQLTTEIQKINLDTLKFPDVLCCDGTVTTLIFYYDGKRKFFRSMIPPKHTRGLISLLYMICREDKQRTSEKFNIENPK